MEFPPFPSGVVCLCPRGSSSAGLLGGDRILGLYRFSYLAIAESQAGVQLALQGSALWDRNGYPNHVSGAYRLPRCLAFPSFIPHLDVGALASGGQHSQRIHVLAAG